MDSSENSKAGHQFDGNNWDEAFNCAVLEILTGIIRRLSLKESLLRRTSKTYLALLVLCAAAVTVYGYARNVVMHDDLMQRITSDADILAESGPISSVKYDSSGGNVEFGGSRSETLWILKVVGEKGCVYVHAVLHDNFPKYHVVSVSPATSLDGQIRYCRE